VLAQAGIQVQLSVKEIYDRVCPKCKKVIKELIKEKISEQMVEKVIGS
jgi:phage FluMu protein Com